ncbi:MAG: alpha/beta hydrolase, partial [Moraxellaceae bacterium]
SSVAANNATTFNYGDHFLQKADLRLPVTSINDPLPAPVIVVIHGGCWTTSLASYRIMDELSDAITALGYATWNIEYRGIGSGGEWPIIFQDVGMAVDYLRVVAQSHPIDITRVATIGHSAGGHLALWAASRKKINAESLIYSSDPLNIRGAISLAGVLDLTAVTACGNSGDAIIGEKVIRPDGTRTLRLNDTSPIHMLPANIRSVIISGAIDSIVREHVGISYSNAATISGDASVHYTLQGLGHFELINPSQTVWSLYQTSFEELLRD